MIRGASDWLQGSHPKRQYTRCPMLLLNNSSGELLFMAYAPHPTACMQATRNPCKGSTTCAHPPLIAVLVGRVVAGAQIADHDDHAGAGVVAHLRGEREMRGMLHERIPMAVSQLKRLKLPSCNERGENERSYWFAPTRCSDHQCLESCAAQHSTCRSLTLSRFRDWP